MMTIIQMSPEQIKDLTNNKAQTVVLVHSHAVWPTLGHLPKYCVTREELVAGFGDMNAF